MNTVTLYQRDNTRQIQEIKLHQSKTEKLRKLVNCRIIPKVSPYTLSKCTQISPELWHFSPQVQKRYDYVTKRTRKSIKISFCFQTGDKTVRYLRVYPLALRLYHPSAPLYNLWLRLRLYRSASG
jgi:hypothetical protein